MKFVKLSRYATSLVSNSKDEMSRFLTGTVEDLEDECREAMLHDCMDLYRHMVHVQQVEESKKRKHTRAGNKSRQAEENYSRKSSTQIRDKPIVKGNNKVDRPQERPPCRKYENYMEKSV